MNKYDLINIRSEQKFNKDNLFEIVPNGIYISDIFNVGVVSLDQKENFDLFTPNSFKSFKEFKRRFFTQFGINADSFLPYHFVVMYVDGEVHISTTRPISYKSLVDNYEEYICIAIFGNTNVDNYTSVFYESMSNLINGLRFMRGYSHKTRHNIEFDKSLDDSHFHKELLLRNLL